MLKKCLFFLLFLSVIICLITGCTAGNEKTAMQAGSNELLYQTIEQGLKLSGKEYYDFKSPVINTSGYSAIRVMISPIKGGADGDARIVSCGKDGKAIGYLGTYSIIFDQNTGTGTEINVSFDVPGRYIYIYFSSTVNPGFSCSVFGWKY